MSTYIIKNKKTGEIVKKINKYPYKYEGSKINGFDYDTHQIYIVIDSQIPSYNDNYEKITEEIYYLNTYYLPETYYNVKIAQRSWVVSEYPTQVILNKLNESLGFHLDTQYPLWERAKHAGEGTYILWNKTEDSLTEEEIARKSYIDRTYAWISGCRAERDRREYEFLVNNVHPSFEWENRPE